MPGRPDLVRFARGAVNFALVSIDLHYGSKAPDPDKRLDYHGVAHSRRVSRDAARLAERMRCFPREIELARVAGAWHDIVRDWFEVRDKEDCMIRRSCSPQDEAGSFGEFRRFAALYPSRACSVPDTDETALVGVAIMATVPAFGPASGEVWQPLLMSDTHRVVRAVALADINGAALADTPEKVAASAREVDLLVREYELDLSRALRDLKTRAEVPVYFAEKYRGRMLAAIERQTRFLTDRHRRLPGELGSCAKNPNVLQVINRENIERVIAEVQVLRDRRLEMGFWELAADMGYDIPAS